ncbi:MAG: hypothetical protein Q8Q09_17010 [Deltaproteobacteria bacterium]|nr:hypothetical protein [Deltaproteobacteria bacterium]
MNTPVSAHVSAPPVALTTPEVRTDGTFGGLAARQSVALVYSSHPLQYPRSYWVRDQLWTLYSTVAQDSFEVHAVRSDPRTQSVLAPDLLTASDHHLSAYASLAQSPERVALAFDDDSLGPRSSRFAMLGDPASVTATQPLQPDSARTLFVGETSASMAWSATDRQWGVIAGSRDHLVFARLARDGALIAGSANRIDSVGYVRGCGESFLHNGRAWVALAGAGSLGLSLLEFDTRSHRLVRLGLGSLGQVVEASMSHHGGRYGVAWVDERGAQISVVRDAQTHTRPVILADSTARAGSPVIAMDGSQFVVLWTENPSISLVRRAVVSHEGVLIRSELFASHPTQHQWFPHLSPVTNGPRLAHTWQSGQSEARVWVSE